jgi:hypothetical protein
LQKGTVAGTAAKIRSRRVKDLMVVVSDIARISHPVPGEGGFEGFLGVVGRFWNGAAGT